VTATDSTWIRDVAARLRTHQLANRFSPHTPEQEAVRFVLKALAEGGCPATAAVLESIDRQRAGLKEAA
jgi:hypothetical protein